MIKAHLDGVLNAIERGVTNARLEGINSVIQWLKKSARAATEDRDRLPHRHLLPSRRARPLPRFAHIPHENLKSQRNPPTATERMLPLSTVSQILIAQQHGELGMKNLSHSTLLTIPLLAVVVSLAGPTPSTAASTHSDGQRARLCVFCRRFKGTRGPMAKIALQRPTIHLVPHRCSLAPSPEGPIHSRLTAEESTSPILWMWRLAKPCRSFHVRRVCRVHPRLASASSAPA